MGRRIIPLKGKRRRQGLIRPPASPPTFHLKGDIARTVGVIRLLLETPSGFGIFSVDGTYLQKDTEDIWSYFVDKLWLHNVIWLKEFIRVENKSTAINLETADIHVDLIRMLKKWCDSEEKLVVGRIEYKRIIERNMEITCLYDHNVEEVMWGLKNNMQFLVPQEETKLTAKDYLPISKGLEMFLIQYQIDMKPEMVNVHIAQQAGILHRTDLALKKHSAFFKLVGESVKNISDIDSKDWSSIKLATAAVIIRHPEKKIQHSQMFSQHEYSKIKEDASRYGEVIVEVDTWLIYRDVVFLSEKKSRTKMKLDRLIKEAEKVDPILAGSQESQALEDSTGVIDVKSGETFIMSPRPEQPEMKFVPARNEMKQVDSTSQITSNQPSIAEGQHFLMSDDLISANDVDKGDERSTAKDIMENLGERSTTKDISARKVYKEFDVKHNEYQKQSGGTSANDVAAEESIGSADGKKQTEDACLVEINADDAEKLTKDTRAEMNLMKLTEDARTEMNAVHGTEGIKIAENTDAKKASDASSMGNVTDGNQAEEAGAKGDAKHTEHQKQSAPTLVAKLAGNSAGKGASESSSTGYVVKNNHGEEAGAKGMGAVPEMENLGAKHTEHQKESAPSLVAKLAGNSAGKEASESSSTGYVEKNNHGEDAGAKGMGKVPEMDNLGAKHTEHQKQSAPTLVAKLAGNSAAKEVSESSSTGYVEKDNHGEEAGAREMGAVPEMENLGENSMPMGTKVIIKRFRRSKWPLACFPLRAVRLLSQVD